MKEIFLDSNGEVFKSTDYKEKCEEIKKRLKDELFSEFREEDFFDKEYDSSGNVINVNRKKVAVKKNQLLPILSPTRVQTRLESILRLYRPLTLTEAKSLNPNSFLEAYTYYCELIDFINKYIIFKTTKQSFCAFAGITVDTYNELGKNVDFEDTIRWINDGLVGAIFVDSASGLYDSRAIISEGQTKDAGMNLIKNPDSIVFKGNTFVNHQEVDNKILKFEGMIDRKQIGNKK